ncbi:hypothetical protein JCM3775_002367 [Rhodotorula graminis]
MSAAEPKPEVLPVFGPSSLSPTRIFLSLVILLGFLLVARFSPSRTRSAHKVALKARRSGARTVLLVGPLASGKTSLFSKLVYGHAPQTHTSMKENEAVVKAKWGEGGSSAHELVDDQEEKEGLLDADTDQTRASPLPTPLHLVDLPGHARLRTRALAQYLPAADGVVFAVDGQGGLTGKNVRDAGEHFHILLSLLSLLSTSSNKPAPPVLVLLTKADLAPSTSTTSTSNTSSPSSPAASTASSHLALDRARQLLLRELERRRLASSGAGSASALKGASGAPLSAGARLDGLDAIPSGAPSSSKGPWAALLGALGLASSTSATGGIGALDTSSSSGGAGAGGAGGGLPSDESEALALAADDVFAFEGSATWDKLERAVGVELRWAVASVRGGAAGKGKGGKEGKGVDEVWEWVEAL